MRSALALAAAVLLSGCQYDLAATRYARADSDGGYSERIVEPGVWRVTATANGFTKPGFGRWMAFHRAAELVSAAGFPYMQVLDARAMRQICYGMCTGGEAIQVWVRGAGSAEPPADCRADDEQICRTVPAEALMAELAPLLGFSGASVTIRPREKGATGEVGDNYR